jgi:hypothetical protein
MARIAACSSAEYPLFLNHASAREPSAKPLTGSFERFGVVAENVVHWNGVGDAPLGVSPALFVPLVGGEGGDEVREVVVCNATAICVLVAGKEGAERMTGKEETIANLGVATEAGATTGKAFTNGDGTTGAVDPVDCKFNPFTSRVN